jgi:hypothetical protein
MLDIGWDVQNPSRTEQMRLPIHMEAHLAGEDIGDLLVGMTVRPRLVLWHQTMQRDGRAFTRESLALNAGTHRRPWDGAPVDLVGLHVHFLILAESFLTKHISRPVTAPLSPDDC